MHPYAKPLLEILERGFDGLLKNALADVAVAVIDSGVDASHPALVGRVQQAYAIEGGNAVSTSLTGHNDARGHGTAVAHIVTQVAPNARIVDVRALSVDHQSNGDELVEALRHALTLPISVVNMSLVVRPKWRGPMTELCELAHRRNIAVVASAQNSPLGSRGLPAELASVISVDYHTMEGLYSVLYRQRNLVEFAAMGQGITAAEAGGGYTEVTGTSFATPVVSGLCALLRGVYPSLRPYELQSILKALAARHVES